jgi:hypothetical protein
MTFKLNQLHVLAYVSKFTLWHFRGLGESLDDTSSNNFFGAAAGMLQCGDMIVVSVGDGGRILIVSFIDAQTSMVVTSPLS